MDKRKLFKVFDLNNALIAKFFQYSAKSSYENSSAKGRVEHGSMSLINHVVNSDTFTNVIKAVEELRNSGLLLETGNSSERTLFEVLGSLENKEDPKFDLDYTEADEKGNEGYRIYYDSQYAFDVYREHIGIYEELKEFNSQLNKKDFEGVDSDGYRYHFYSDHESFEPITVNEAIILMLQEK